MNSLVRGRLAVLELFYWHLDAWSSSIGVPVMGYEKGVELTNKIAVSRRFCLQARTSARGVWPFI